MKQETLQLTGANYKGSRRKLDFYPTPENVTVALMEFLKLPKETIVWEPASGQGHMSKVLERYVNVFSSDISEDCYGVPGIDFLDPIKDIVAADAVITNPPFYSSEQFIRKGVKHYRTVAMLLKSQYWHAACRTGLFEVCPPSYVLPLTWRPDFLEGQEGGG